jgi:hypothetical protein
MAVNKEISGFSKYDADRIASLWNAADGMTTEEAVRYLEHGPEMVEAVRANITLCRTKFDHDSCEDNGGEYDCKLKPHCKRHDLLAKLEGK